MRGDAAGSALRCVGVWVWVCGCVLLVPSCVYAAGGWGQARRLRSARHTAMVMYTALGTWAFTLCVYNNFTFLRDLRERSHPGDSFVWPFLHIPYTYKYKLSLDPLSLFLSLCLRRESAERRRPDTTVHRRMHSCVQVPIYGTRGTRRDSAPRGPISVDIASLRVRWAPRSG